MRPTAIILGIMFLATPCAFAQQPAPLINPNGAGGYAGAQADIPADAGVDTLLDALDQRGQTLREFTGRVSLTKGEAALGEQSTNTGQIVFQKKGNDDGRLRVIFDKRIDGKVTRDEKSEFLLDNGWLIDRDYRKHAQTSREVVKPGEKINLLKLGEGPFPLPIGQKKEDVKKLFDVTLIPPPKDGPADLADAIHLKLKPKEGTRFFRKFGAINVWVDRKTHFPVRIDTVAPDGSDKHTTKLTDIKINPQPGLNDGDFVLPKIDQEGWSLHTEPYKE